jgi:hypothetical protein
MLIGVYVYQSEPTVHSKIFSHLTHFNQSLFP